MADRWKILDLLSGSAGRAVDAAKNSDTDEDYLAQRRMRGLSDAAFGIFDVPAQVANAAIGDVDYWTGGGLSGGTYDPYQFPMASQSAANLAAQAPGFKPVIPSSAVSPEVQRRGANQQALMGMIPTDVTDLTGAGLAMAAVPALKRGANAVSDLVPAVKAAQKKAAQWLPSSSSLNLPDAPTADVLKNARVENVPLSQARGTQPKMDWDKFGSGEHPGPLVPGYEDMPIAVRREDGEYLIYDGHHRAVRALESELPDMPMYVIDAKDYAPHAAGVKPQPSTIDDDELLRELLGDSTKSQADDLVPAVKAAQKGIRAYHGSPHGFEKFDLSKIGTGEGAQAYGHGLYFADNESVAMSYRDALKKHTDDMYHGDQLLTGDEELAGSVLMGSPDKQAAIDWLKAQGNDRFVPIVERLDKDLLRKEKPAPGHMYEVNINADPDAFLDWDKPLSEQPQSVRDALAAMDPDTYHPSGGDYDPMEPGQIAYQRLAAQKRDYGIDSGKNDLTTLGGAQAGATKDLQGFGIPGIKYLDAGSRNGQYWMDVANDGTISVLGPNRASFGTFPTREEALAFSKQKNEASGSRNYVVFSDEIIDIVKKYGIAGALGAGLITQQMADQLEAQQGGGQS